MFLFPVEQDGYRWLLGLEAGTAYHGHYYIYHSILIGALLQARDNNASSFVYVYTTLPELLDIYGHYSV